MTPAKDPGAAGKTSASSKRARSSAAPNKPAAAAKPAAEKPATSRSKKAAPAATPKSKATSSRSSKTTPPPAATPPWPVATRAPRAAKPIAQDPVVDAPVVDQAPEIPAAASTSKARGPRGPYNVMRIEKKAVTYRLPLDVIALVGEARAEAAAAGERLTHDEAISRAVRWFYGKRRRR